MTSFNLISLSAASWNIYLELPWQQALKHLNLIDIGIRPYLISKHKEKYDKRIKRLMGK